MTLDQACVRRDALDEQEGFTLSYVTRTDDRDDIMPDDGSDEYAVRVRCDQCEACAINGLACHETGCPNEMHECKGCNARVSRRGSYCEDCR